MKKQIRDFKIVECRRIHECYALLRLTTADGADLPEILPGQFVQVRIDRSKTTFLRRPISINLVDPANNELWLLVRNAGPGTESLMTTEVGEIINLLLPLGNGFSIPSAADSGKRLLLVGGGVGVAPLLELGKKLKTRGFDPCFLLGARSKSDLLQADLFAQYGEVFFSTDDGSAGVKGVVTAHPICSEHWDMVYCCGPAPMMKAVAQKARHSGSCCEVSLENMMACGLGACLCCVEKTVKGNVCVCTEGPVFNIEQLTW
ncbi:MAG: dihydroorotate dehydrogenase electron transfer subunit [Bacteroides sp.]|nr:dihydroorotate dehydrogenase electron transfer subunit [Bacteroides sp.]MCM1413109.1 dihydroorotate dehydrogenase electron transfer subunit [Bacteroides sp.]MCM1472149.1 dihydroorotate dehydrogenase electron transfer subunit [Bacteroides sp.]